jgi:Asp-tRNA(Asn)/Glu-tRNA(Gln) amidotransferase A subunit family amidase
MKANVEWIIVDRKDTFDGAPVGLQVMGRRLQEEKVLGLAEAIANALQDFTGNTNESVDM